LTPVGTAGHLDDRGLDDTIKIAALRSTASVLIQTDREELAIGLLGDILPVQVRGAGWATAAADEPRKTPDNAIRFGLRSGIARA